MPFPTLYRPPSPVRLRLLGALVLSGVVGGCTMQRPLTTSDYRALLPVLEARVEADPTDASALHALAEALVRVGETGRAYDALLEAERLDGDPRTYYALGLAEEVLGNLDEAAARYEEADPTSPYATDMAARSARLSRSVAEADLAAVLGRDGYPDPPYAQGDVAVFPFAPAGEEDPSDGPLGRGVSEAIATALASVSGLRVVPSVRIAVLLRHHGRAPADIDPAHAQRLGRLLQVRHVVIGRVGGEDGLPLGATLVDTAVGSNPDTTGVGVITASSLFDGVREVSLRLLSEMGVGLTASERDQLGRAPTKDLDALVLYGEGLLEEDAGRFDEAAAFYAEAAQRDPSFRLAAERAEALGGPAPRAPDEALLALRFTDGMIAAEGLVARRVDALGRTMGSLIAPEAGARNPEAEVGAPAAVAEPFPDPPSPPGQN